MIKAQLAALQDAVGTLKNREIELCGESKDTLKVLVQRDDLMGRKRKPQEQPQYVDKLFNLEA